MTNQPEADAAILLDLSEWSQDEEDDSEFDIDLKGIASRIITVDDERKAAVAREYQLLQALAGLFKGMNKAMDSFNTLSEATYPNPEVGSGPTGAAVIYLGTIDTGPFDQDEDEDES